MLHQLPHKLPPPPQRQHQQPPTTQPKPVGRDGKPDLRGCCAEEESAASTKRALAPHQQTNAILGSLPTLQVIIHQWVCEVAVCIRCGGCACVPVSRDTKLTFSPLTFSNLKQCRRLHKVVTRASNTGRSLVAPEAQHFTGCRSLSSCNKWP